MIENTASIISAEFQDFLHSQWVLMPNWKWITLTVGFFFVLFLNKLIRLILSKLKKRFEIPVNLKEQTFISFFVKQKIEKGLSWIISALIGMAIIQSLELSANLEKYFLIALQITLSLHVLRLAYFAADASGDLIQNIASKSQSSLNDQIAPLATKTLKVLVILVGSLVIMQNFGVNVTALLAGLGLGGMALAFAAQDTVANVFGTITILLDSPFRVGDRIKIADVDGIVEEVGFRSTRIRTLYNSVVTMPNSVVAKEKIDNLQQRNGLSRFRHTFGFVYNTSPEQIEAFRDAVTYYLKQDTRVNNDTTLVQMTLLGESSIDILINFHFNFAINENEALIMHQYLMDLFKIAQSQKLDFAFPTRTIHLNSQQS